MRNRPPPSASLNGLAAGFAFWRSKWVSGMGGRDWGKVAGATGVISENLPQNRREAMFRNVSQCDKTAA